jgi:hypothetical protein
MTERNTNCIVVLGMHRSGTSALTQYLVEAGFGLPGPSLPPHLKDNPGGYWEPRDLMLTNNRIINYDTWIKEPQASSDKLWVMLQEQCALRDSEKPSPRIEVPRFSATDLYDDDDPNDSRCIAAAYFAYLAEGARRGEAADIDTAVSLSVPACNPLYRDLCRGGAGLVAENADEWAANLAALSASATGRKEIAELALKRARALYGPSAILSAWRGLLKKVVGSSGSVSFTR